MRLPSWVYWTVMLMVGLLIIIFNDVFGEGEGFVLFGMAYFVLLFVSVVRWIFLQVRSIIALKRDKLKMEMLHLQSQVNPHFFFNMLNNLYGLIEQQPKEAKGLILKLSELMRYSIYEGQNEWVGLEDEVKYLNNYMELNKSRYHKSVDLDFDLNIKEQGYRIMPLLLILLVENAFKHGVEKLRAGAFVRITLNADHGQIEFNISNNFDPEDEEDHQTGIGISNLRRRLEIGYKKKFKLELSEEDDIFQAHLILDKV